MLTNVLALFWFHEFQTDAKDEWELWLTAMKAV